MSSRTCRTSRCSRSGTRSRSSRISGTPSRSPSSTASTASSARTGSVTSGWRPSPMSTSPARTRGDRHPRDRRPRDRDLGSVRGRGDGVDALAGERMIRYDARGLVEVDDTVLKISEIEGEKAVFDAKDLSTRKINLELRWLLYEQGVKDVTVLNPGAKHSLGVGILTRCKITFDGSLGYFGCGVIDGPEIHIKGRVGRSVCDNMISGVVVTDCNAGSPPDFQKFGCGKKLYNYDNLEPSERKLVL